MEPTNCTFRTLFLSGFDRLNLRLVQKSLENDNESFKAHD